MIQSNQQAIEPTGALNAPPTAVPDVDLADGAATVSSRETVYRLARADWLDGWWTWAVIVVLIALAVWASVRLYRRDTQELRRSVRWSLIWLRLVVIAGVIFLFFDLERRTRQLIERPSEVAVLVDTSQSMSLPADNRVESSSRSEVAAEVLGETGLLQTMAEDHRVTVYGFDSADELRELEVRSGGVVSEDGLSENGGAGEPEQDSGQTAAAAGATASGLAQSSRLAVVGGLTILAALALALASLLLGATGRTAAVGQPILGAAVLMVLGGIALGVAWSSQTDRSLASLLGLADDAAIPVSEPDPDEPPEPATPAAPRVADWQEALAASGTQSRIGDAVRDALTRHDPSTLAGIVLLTDGQSNIGTPLSSAAALAARNGVAVYPVGLGSADAPVNVRIVDLDAPRRVYPGDKFSLSAVLQASGPEALSVQVQLLDAEDTEDRITNVVDSRQVELPVDGTLTGVRFDLEPEAVGRRKLAVRVVPPPRDQNETDDYRDARYEVVARKLNVLAIAGGPTREYRFVRNLLYRDESTRLSVLLQSGQPGMSQDADEQLQEFPRTAEELFQYDAIIAFDPNWLALDAGQLDLLDRWLSEQAGGLVLVAGPVYMPEWMRLRTDPRVSTLAGFFPVNLATRSSLISGGRQGGETQWPLRFTPEARRTEFLWVTDEPESSFAAWEESGGVYDFIGVKDAKPGATVYAYFSDPTTSINDSPPVYMASQFYGAGRVFFQASGEMWRLRGVSDALFDSYYTKLLRWASAGRLLRDSTRGVLLVDQPRALIGETVTVRAVLTDEQFQPLEAPSVQADLLAPNGRIETVQLTPLESEPRPGTYGGRFVVREAGSYELRLTLGDALSEQVLRQTVQARLPTLELERPRRNDDELTAVAALTGGSYLPINEPANVTSGGTSDGRRLSELTAMIRPQPQTTVLPGTPDLEFAKRRNATLMWLLASCLGFEWVVRRLQRLA